MSVTLIGAQEFKFILFILIKISRSCVTSKLCSACSNLRGFNAFRERPSGHDVVNHSFSERFWNGVDLHEFLDAVEHLVVAR